MLECNDCGCRFDESDTITKDEFGRPIYICPNCGSEDWEGLHKCRCGEYIRDSEDLCENCKEITQTGVAIAVAHMVEEDKKLCWHECLEMIKIYIEEEGIY